MEHYLYGATIATLALVLVWWLMLCFAKSCKAKKSTLVLYGGIIVSAIATMILAFVASNAVLAGVMIGIAVAMMCCLPQFLKYYDA